jgi:cyclic dehypoxanthinyl futalosine synthase
MNKSDIFSKTLNKEFLSVEEACFIFQEAPLSELMLVANEIRKQLKPDNKVTWIIDRNVNITNVCISGCKFCNFYCAPNSAKAYLTSSNDYKQKIDEMIAIGGSQLLLQGGCHPELGLKFYVNLFSELKRNYTQLKLHALGPPEIVHISKLEKISYRETLQALMNAGLDSLPGAGAEILSDRVRSFISKNKCDVQEWLDVMREAHLLNLTTTATMMFGHYETIAERMQHLVFLRETQIMKPAASKGFIAFIPWPFQDQGTVLQKQYQIKNKVTPDEYIRMIAISRIMLPNIQNIQASWLTVGKETAQICLHAGANDLGSIMMEENVVSSAGVHHTMDASKMQEAIRDAGFSPQYRNQQYEFESLEKK